MASSDLPSLLTFSRATTGEIAPAAGLANHVERRPVLDTARVGPFQLRVEAEPGGGEGLVDPEHRGAADQLGRPTGSRGDRGERPGGGGSCGVEVIEQRAGHQDARLLRAPGHAKGRGGGEWVRCQGNRGTVSPRPRMRLTGGTLGGSPQACRLRSEGPGDDH